MTGQLIFGSQSTFIWCCVSHVAWNMMMPCARKWKSSRWKLQQSRLETLLTHLSKFSYAIGEMPWEDEDLQSVTDGRFIHSQSIKCLPSKQSLKYDAERRRWTHLITFKVHTDRLLSAFFVLQCITLFLPTIAFPWNASIVPRKSTVFFLKGISEF